MQPKVTESVSEPARKLVRFKRGEYLFRQGETTTDLFIIKSGDVRIYKTEGSATVELDRALAGMIVGEVAIIDGGPRSASGVAEADVEAYCITAKEFYQLTSQIPDWLRKISVILAQRLREVDGKIDLSLSGERTAQVAALMVMMISTKYCKVVEHGYELPRKFLEGELMDILNLQFSDIHKILEFFASRELITFDSTRVIILSKELLKSECKEIFAASISAPVL